MKKSIIDVSTLHNEFEKMRLACESDKDFLALNAAVEKANKDLFEKAVEVVATSENPMVELLALPAVAQFAPVEDNGESVAIKKNMRPVVYSNVASFIKKHNKTVEKEGKGEKLALPFDNVDYVLINIFGANIAKEVLSSLDEKNLERLSEYRSSVDCFKANSNKKMKEQLMHIYGRIENVAGVELGIHPIEKSVKLLTMEFIRYKGANNTLRVNSADKLVDFVLNQYIISRDKIAITVKSGLDIHKKPADK